MKMLSDASVAGRSTLRTFLLMQPETSNDTKHIAMIAAFQNTEGLNEIMRAERSIVMTLTDGFICLIYPPVADSPDSVRI